MGDVASAIDNVRLQRIRPQYTTRFFRLSHDDRRAVMLETMALHRLHEQHPDVILVPGHDAIELRPLENDGLLRRGFGEGGRVNAGRIPGQRGGVKAGQC